MRIKESRFQDAWGSHRDLAPLCGKPQIRINGINKEGSFEWNPLQNISDYNLPFIMVSQPSFHQEGYSKNN